MLSLNTMLNEAPRFDTKASKDKVSPMMAATIHDRSTVPSPRAGALHTRGLYIRARKLPSTRVSAASTNRHVGRATKLDSGLNIASESADNHTPYQRPTFSQAMCHALRGSSLLARSDDSAVDQTPCLFPMDGFDTPGHWRNFEFRKPVVFDAGI